MASDDPHGDAKVYSAGPALADASAAIVVVHGRGANADDAISLARVLLPPVGSGGVAILAPEAHGRTWYPHSFLVPWEQNEPHVSSALARIGRVIAQIRAQGIDAKQTLIAGFSQGACLACEFIARSPGEVAAAAILTGGLIGREISGGAYSGRFEGTPVYFATGDPDPHVPVQRVRESADILQAMGASVQVQVTHGRPHTVLQDEAAEVQEMFRRVL